MGTTPNLAIPYVEPADQLANFPAADKAKADRIEALLYDTGWVNLTPTSGSGQFQYRCFARTVWVRASISGMTSAASGNNMPVLAAGILPAAYRPGVTVYGASSMAGAYSGLINVGPDGAIGQWNNVGSAVTVARFTLSWPKEGAA